MESTGGVTSLTKKMPKWLTPLILALIGLPLAYLTMVRTHAGCGFSKAIPSLPSSHSSPSPRLRRIIIDSEAASNLTTALTLAGLITEPEIDPPIANEGSSPAPSPMGGDDETLVSAQPYDEDLEDETRWIGGPLPSMNGTWCSRSSLRAGAVDILLEESFIRADESTNSVLDGGELNLSVPNVIDFGVVTFNRLSFYRPVRLCHEWTASVLIKSPEVEALLNHDVHEIASAFREFWDVFEPIWDNENLNQTPCGDLLILTASREDSREDVRDSPTNRWLCD